MKRTSLSMVDSGGNCSIDGRTWCGLLNNSSTHHRKGALMDSPAIWLGVFILSFVLLDILALKFGVNSQSPASDQKNWW
jgi:hypothetical protein